MRERRTCVNPLTIQLVIKVDGTYDSFKLQDESSLALGNLNQDIS